MYRDKKSLINQKIQPEYVVLDVGFLGQGITESNPDWPHTLIKNRAKEVYGLDLELSDAYKGDSNYLEASAEDFSFSIKFDVIFAGDIIEHLSNPGLFFDSVRKNLAPDGVLILTTPNTFNLYNLAEKLSKDEPSVNSDHTFYFNKKVLATLLRKNGFEIKELDYLYLLEYSYKESLKKKFLNMLYKFFGAFTNKFAETLVVVAVPV